MRELQIVLDGCARRDERQAWLAAQYATFAFHAPKEMPEDPMKARDAQPVKSEVHDEIRAIRRRVKLAYDTKRARGRNGS